MCHMERGNLKVASFFPGERGVQLFNSKMYYPQSICLSNYKFKMIAIFSDDLAKLQDGDYQEAQNGDYQEAQDGDYQAPRA